MPISEDEYDYRAPQDHHISMSKAELRKTHKPIMEKRRRARINQCLNEIKSLILEAMNKDPARHSKLEKADILEMAVKHLQNVQRQQLALAMATDPSVLRKFKSGFSECTSEIDRYISQIEGVDSGLKDRVTSHLQKCIGGIEQVAHFSFPGFANLPFMTAASSVFARTPALSDTPSNLGDQNNNATTTTRIQIPQGIQVIPSRLPSGDIALLLPNSSNLPLLPTVSGAPSSRNRPSAFATVTPSSAATADRPESQPSSPCAELELDTDKPSLLVQSPQGFRPVQPSKYHTSYSPLKVEPQVAHVSSTSLHSPQTELRTIKFPIQLFSDSKDRRTISPLKKAGDPLCIITNQSERFKRAQTPEDSVTFEENRPQQYQYGVKRKYDDSSLGLLAIASQSYSYPPAPPAKILKTSEIGQSSSTPSNAEDRQEPSGSRSNNESNSDMWRPW